MVLWIAVTIPAVILGAAISFVQGVRYCANKMIPGIVAGKTDEELDVFADEVAAKREEIVGG